MPLSKDKLEEFKKMLVEERDLILEDFKDSSSDYEDLVSQGSGGDIVDMASNMIEKNLLIGISDREQETLKKIEAALQRIEEGNYGICEVTGEEIELERLEAIPYTTLCQAEAMKRSRLHFPEM